MDIAIAIAIEMTPDEGAVALTPPGVRAFVGGVVHDVGAAAVGVVAAAA